MFWRYLWQAGECSSVFLRFSEPDFAPPVYVKDPRNFFVIELCGSISSMILGTLRDVARNFRAIYAIGMAVDGSVAVPSGELVRILA